MVYTILAVVFSACSGSDESIRESRPVEILVSTGFGSASGVETRVAGSIGKERIFSNGPLHLSVVRIDQISESDASYLPYTERNEHGQGQAPRSGCLEGYNSDIRMKFDTEEYYLLRSQNNNTKLIGWYPQVDNEINGSSWLVDNGVATVNFTVDGQTDILMSNLVEGNVDHPYKEESNKLIFKHLLTRFRVCIYTTDANVPAVWGGVTGVSLVGKSQVCRVQLPSVESPSNTYPTDIIFDGNSNLPLIPKDPVDNSPILGYDNPDNALPIPVVDGYVEGDDIGFAGYAMVAPEADALFLIVQTKYRTSLPIKIEAPLVDGFAAGSSYTIALSVNANAVVPAGVTITDWDFQNEGEGIIN